MVRNSLFDCRKTYFSFSNFSSTDMWGLGCLVWEAFNGPLRVRSNLKDLENVSCVRLILYKSY